MSFSNPRVLGEEGGGAEMWGGAEKKPNPDLWLFTLLLR